MGWVCVLAVMAVSPALWAVSPAACAGSEGQMDLLLDAIAEVESRGNAVSVGDSGRAAGVYQIHRSYWADGTRILGVDWDYRDAQDPQKARQVVRAYLSHYGRGKALLDVARIHNGGPKGDEKEATLAYARKIAQIFYAKSQAGL
jgi:hypothetical protein